MRISVRLIYVMPNCTHFQGACHRIFCDPTRELTNQLCILREKTEESFCYVIYIKLTPNDATKFYVGNDRGIMPTRIKDLFGEDRSQVLVSNIYIKQHKLNWSAHYLVMELLVKVYSSEVDFIFILIHKYHNKWNVISGDLNLWSEFVMATHRPLNNTMYRYLSVWENAADTADIIRDYDATENVYNRTSCGITGPVLLDHLHVCPFIRLSLADINVTVVNNDKSLVINKVLGNTTTPHMVIPRWDFRMENGSVLMCLSTYRKIYKSILTISAAELIYSNDANMISLKVSFAYVYIMLHTMKLKFSNL